MLQPSLLKLVYTSILALIIHSLVIPTYLWMEIGGYGPLAYYGAILLLFMISYVPGCLFAASSMASFDMRFGRREEYLAARDKYSDALVKKASPNRFNLFLAALIFLAILGILSVLSVYDNRPPFYYVSAGSLFLFAIISYMLVVLLHQASIIPDTFKKIDK